jgi:hypothetical protein
MSLNDLQYKSGTDLLELLTDRRVAAFQAVRLKVDHINTRLTVFRRREIRFWHRYWTEGDAGLRDRYLRLHERALASYWKARGEMTDLTLNLARTAALGRP